MPLRSKLSPVYTPEGVDMWKWIEVLASRFVDRTALIEWPSGRSLGFRQFLTDVKRVAGALWSMGVRQGDIVLIFAPNSIETPVVTFALMAIGAVMTACNPTYKSDELHHHVMECQSKFVVTSPELVPLVKEVKKLCSVIQTVIAYGDQPGDFTSYEQLLCYDGPPAPRVHVNPEEDMCFLFFSSGTTGRPKGVVHTHSTMMAALQAFTHPDISFFKTDEPDTYVCFMPFFHIYGGAVMALMLAHGKTLVVMKHFDLEHFMKLNVKYKCKSIFTVPPVATLMAKHPEAAKFDWSYVEDIFCGAAPLGQEIQSELSAKLGLAGLKQGYGMTEAFTHMCGKLRKPGSVGELFPNTECKVVDLSTGEELGPGKEGEICSRGPQMMKGYYNRPEATAETIDKDGWLHSGDIGYYDEDELFYITGRVKELIKYKGMQVAPAALEDLLLSHSAIQDVAVIGLPDQIAGELPLAFVVLKPNHNATEQEIKQFVAERAAPFKQLRGGVRFVNEIPKSPSGKILRRILTQSLKSNKL